jgi:hypothetical protein
MPPKTKKHCQSAPNKKSYSSPSLTHFGAIQELTTGGTAPSGEPDMDMKKVLKT